MSLKAKLTTFIVAFALLATMLIVGVLSVKKTDFDVGGSITFDVKGIKAKIELVSLDNGSLKDEPDQEGKLETIEIDNDMTEDEVADAFALWQGLKLQFDTEEPEDVVMQLKITNLAEIDEDNYINISASASFEKTENCRISVANNAGGAAAMLSPGDDATFTITFSVKNPDYSAAMDGFVVDFNMQKKALADIPVGAEGLTFDYADENEDSLQVAWDGSTTFDDTVEIPAFVNYEDTILPVTWIAEYGFSGCETLESIVLPNSITGFYEGAFSGCILLTSITIPNSFTSEWNDYIFSGCTSLESIVVTDDNPVYDSRNNCNAIIETATNILVIGCNNTVIPNGVTCIRYEAFCSCASLESITIPDSVISIGENAFQNCTSLTNITIPSSVTSIGQGAFSNCENLQYNEKDNGKYLGNDDNECLVLIDTITKDFTGFTIQKGCKLIYSGAFQNCTSLKSITIPDSVTSIYTNAFNRCTSLESVIMGKGLTSIGEYAFYGCTSLESITISNSVISIEGSAFQNCTSLTSITIPSSVTSIDGMTFNGCENLTSITISDSVKKIGSRAFEGCISLTGVYYTGTEEEWNAITIEDSNAALESATKHYNHVPA